MGYGNFGLRQRKGLITVQHNAANTKVRATEINREIDTLELVNYALQYPAGRATFSVPLGTAVT